MAQKARQPATATRAATRLLSLVGLVLVVALTGSTYAQEPPTSTSTTATSTTSTSTASTHTEDPWEIDPAEVLDQRPGQGERCLVCGQRIRGDEIVELRFRGRTFHVAAKMLSDFEDNPEAYFQSLQARTALFDESAVVERAMSRGWLLLGLYVLLGLISAAICGYLAVTKALPPLSWFFAGLVGNVAAIFVLLATPKGDASTLPAGIPRGLAKVATTRSPLACAACGHLNHPAARSCGHCGKPFTPSIEPETARV